MVRTTRPSSIVSTVVFVVCVWPSMTFDSDVVPENDALVPGLAEKWMDDPTDESGVGAVWAEISSPPSSLRTSTFGSPKNCTQSTDVRWATTAAAAPRLTTGGCGTTYAIKHSQRVGELKVARNDMAAGRAIDLRLCCERLVVAATHGGV